MLPRDTPAARGVDAAGVAAFLDAVAADELELHGLLVYRAGAVVAEGYWSPYAAHRPHMLHSAVKSWTGAAAGLAIGAGKLRLDDKVVDFFPEHRPDVVSPNLAAMTVRDLLTMRSGHRTGVSGGEWRTLRTSWVAAFLREDVPDRPGEAFIYSSGSSYMLSAIVTKVTGKTVHDLLEERLFAPMGTTGLTWDISPEGYSTGGNGLSCKLEDVLKFGVLHLHGGMWNGTRLLPESWVAQATSNQVREVWMAAMDGRRYLPREGNAGEKREGYGYQWWMTPHGGYRASGMFGQQCVVLPGHDAVIAMTAGLPMREPRLLEHVWTHLLPALGTEGRGDDTLLRRLSTLAFPLPQGTLRGQAGGSYRVEPNEDGVEAITLEFTGTTCRFTLVDARGTHAVEAGLGHLVEADTTMTGAKLHHAYEPGRMRVAAAGAWTAPHSFTMTWRFVETAFCDTVVCNFDGETLTVARSVNTNAAALSRPTLTGHRT